MICHCCENREAMDGDTICETCEVLLLAVLCNCDDYIGYCRTHTKTLATRPAIW